MLAFYFKHSKNPQHEVNVISFKPIQSVKTIFIKSFLLFKKWISALNKCILIFLFFFVLIYLLKKIFLIFRFFIKIKKKLIKSC